MTSEDDSGEDPEYGLFRTKDHIRSFASVSDTVMELLELATAFIMVGLFAIGVYDLLYKLAALIATGNYVDAQNVVSLIDTALLLLIIVEIYRTIVAYFENLNILPLVVNVALIAMARKVISFRVGEYPTYMDALIAAAAYGFLLLIVVATFFLIHHSQEETRFDVYTEPFSSAQDRIATYQEKGPSGKSAPASTESATDEDDSER